jgi:hypothetical protein
LVITSSWFTSVTSCEGFCSVTPASACVENRSTGTIARLVGIGNLRAAKRARRGANMVGGMVSDSELELGEAMVII